MKPCTLRRRALCTLLGALLALTMSGCADRLTNAPAANHGLSLQLRLGADVLGGSTDAFARVDAAHVVVTQATQVLLDTVAAFSASGDGRVTLEVRLSNPSATVTVTVELLGSGRVLFRGSGSADAQRGATVTIPLAITPVVTGLAAPDSIVLTALGDTVRLRGAAVFASGDTVANALATWTGDGGSVAQVGADGLVTALHEGQATATATYGSFSRNTRVRVQAVVTRIALSADTFSLLVDSTRTLTAVARDRNGNALQRTFTWRSSNTSVATVDAGGVVRGIAPGSATITAGSESQTAAATVTVRRIPVAAVKVAPTSASLRPGDTIRLTATTVDSSGATLSGRAVTWASDNPGVATVDAGGLVTAVAEGSATITASCEGKTASAAIQVGQPRVAVSSSNVIFSMLIGAGALAQTVRVTNAGTGLLTGLSARVAYGGTGGWLSAVLGSGTAPTTLVLNANPASLPTGIYSATVTVSSSVPGAGSALIAVQMIVLNPPPVIGISQPIVSLHMRTDTLGAPVKTTLTVYNAGGGTLTGLQVSVSSLSGNCPAGTSWLSASLSSSTAPATLTITAQGYLGPQSYAACTGAVTVTGTGATPASVSVTYGWSVPLGNATPPGGGRAPLPDTSAR